MALVLAISANCVCLRTPGGGLVTVCAPHMAYVHDQRFLDGLLDGRRRATQLLMQEFMVDLPD